MKIKLKRGYEIDIKPEIDSEDIVEIGNYSKSNYNATQIVSRSGISPTVRENHGEVIAIIVEYESTKK